MTATVPSTRSEPVGAKETFAPAGPVASAVTLGAWMVGGVVSTTSTVKAASALLPALSVAVQVTVVPPRANVEPDGGVQLTETVPSTSSVALGTGLKDTFAPSGPVASCDWSASCSVGAVLSRTVTAKVPVALL